ncbi:MAG: hypothetical protein K2L13_01930 [Opitutales bacterium]|nr:hypothetical protein [Opitutales bacterium]
MQGDGSRNDKSSSDLYSKHYKGISRIDSKTTRGWLVRGYKNGKRYSKLFSDRKLGSPEEALRQARLFYQDLSKRLDEIPARPRARKIVYKDSRNSTGVLGISRLRKIGKNGQPLEFYSVTWRPAPGKQKCTSFSIRKYGEAEAFRRAVNCRFDGLSQVYGKEIAVRIIGAENVNKLVGKEYVNKLIRREYEENPVNRKFVNKSS